MEDDENSSIVSDKVLSLYKDTSEQAQWSVAEADISQFLNSVQLTEESRKIQLSFAELVESTMQYLTDTETSLKKVIEHMDAHIPEECCEASDLDDLFFKLVPHMSFFNPDLLKMIIEQTGDKDLQGKFSEYEKKLELYCRNRISGPHPVIFTNKALNTEPLAQKLLVKLDTEWEGLPLAEIKRFHCTIASILNVRQESLVLQSVQKGCVLFTFLIHKSVASRMLESRVTASQEITLQKVQVMSITIGTKTFFMNHSNVHQLHKPITAVVPEQENTRVNNLHMIHINRKR